MVREACHSSKKNLAHLTQVDGIEEKVLGVGRDVNLSDAIFRTAEQDALWAEGVCRADGKFL